MPKKQVVNFQTDSYLDKSDEQNDEDDTCICETLAISEEEAVELFSIIENVKSTGGH